MRSTEWQTWALATLIYSGWILLTIFHEAIPAPLLFVLGGWFVAWHGSLQHETIHGHPTRNARINALIGGWPLSLWLPYAIYRRSHIEHHESPHPTHPDYDPESRYLLPGSRWRLWTARMESTLIGRLLIGPAVSLIRFAVDEAGRLRHQPNQVVRDWGWHLIGVGVVLAWLHHVALPIGAYLLMFVLPGQALTLLRGFAEHRADSLGPSRAATVRSSGPLAWLFLNNNLHAAHHARPELPWYALPAAERARAAWPEPRYAGYRDVARRFLFAPHDHVHHPQGGGTA